MNVYFQVHFIQLFVIIVIHEWSWHEFQIEDGVKLSKFNDFDIWVAQRKSRTQKKIDKFIFGLVNMSFRAKIVGIVWGIVYYCEDLLQLKTVPLLYHWILFWNLGIQTPVYLCGTNQRQNIAKSCSVKKKQEYCEMLMLKAGLDFALK